MESKFNLYKVPYWKWLINETINNQEVKFKSLEQRTTLDCHCLEQRMFEVMLLIPKN